MRLKVLLIAGLLFSSAVASAQERCGAGKDLVVQALERVKADSPTAQLEDANQLLKRAIELCNNLGDAWYYRSLVEGKLGHAQLAAYSLKKAEMFPSDALSDRWNPFVLAAPRGRATGGAGSPSTPSRPAGSAPEKWALIIGIGSFADNHIEPLRYTASDAQSFAAVLLDPKYGHFKSQNVHTLLNAQATTRNIKADLNWLARSAAPDDVVVVYVATHGSSREVDTVGVNYIITHDTELGEHNDPDLLYATALPMVDIANAIATRVRARRAAIFLDTCYSGNAAKPQQKLIAPGVASASVSSETMQHISQGAGRMIFAASGTEEESFESETLKHGFFTYYLVEALKQQNGAVSLSQAFAYTQQHVSQRVAQDYRLYHLQQNPVMSRSEPNTDFSLGAPLTTSARLLPLTPLVLR